MKLFYFFNILIIISFVRLEEDVHNNSQDEYISTINEGKIVRLTGKNFDEFINNHQYVMVKFYAPWCGYCKKIEPEYSKAGILVNNEKMNVTLTKIDTADKDNEIIGQRYEIEGFPTIKFFSNGIPIDYDGEKHAEDILKWIKKKVGTYVIEVTSIENITYFYDKNKVILIFYGTEESYNKTFSVYKKLARDYDDIIFLNCFNEECLKDSNTSEGSVVLLKKFDEKRDVLNDTDFNESILFTFIEKFSRPLQMEFDENGLKDIFGKSIPGLFLYIDNNHENYTKFQDLMLNVAQKFRGSIQLFITDLKGEIQSKLADYVGVDQSDLPTVRIHDTKVELRNYIMNDTITEENVLKFVTAWSEARLKRHLKSEKPPIKQEGNVFTLVGEIFESVVLDKSKDVLIEFYAPWCEECKKIDQVFEELAKRLKNSNNLIIAKMDSTKNEIESLEIEGFPTIKFWPASKKDKPIDYEDESRTMDDFIKFLHKYASNKIKESHDEL